MSDPSYSSTPYDPDRLIAGDAKIITREVTITDISASGALTRGTVLGMVTANGKYGLSLFASADGSQTARAILAKDVDPSGGDVVGIIYDEGEFNEDRITMGAGHVIQLVREDLRAVGIHLKSPVSA